MLMSGIHKWQDIRGQLTSEQQAEIDAIKNTQSFDKLQQQVLARPGASERLAQLREETLKEIEDHEPNQ